MQDVTPIVLILIAVSDIASFAAGAWLCHFLERHMEGDRFHFKY